MFFEMTSQNDYKLEFHRHDAIKKRASLLMNKQGQCITKSETLNRKNFENLF